MSAARSLQAYFLTVVFVCAFVSAAHAQADRGTLTGQVTDQSDAIVPGASVKAIHVATNFERLVTTSDEGSYTITPTGRQLRRHRDRSGFPDDDTREHPSHGGQHGACGRAACRRRAVGCGNGDGGVTTGSVGQREGDDGDQQQVHPGSAAGGRRATPVAAGPEPRRTGSQVRDERRRRTREYRDRR